MNIIEFIVVMIALLLSNAISYINGYKKSSEDAIQALNNLLKELEEEYGQGNTQKG